MKLYLCINTMIIILVSHQAVPLTFYNRIGHMQRISSLNPLKNMNMVRLRTGNEKAFVFCSLLLVAYCATILWCVSSMIVMLFCGGLVVVRKYCKALYSACLLLRKVGIETVRNFASSDMVTLVKPKYQPIYWSMSTSDCVNHYFVAKKQYICLLAHTVIIFNVLLNKCFCSSLESWVETIYVCLPV